MMDTPLGKQWIIELEQCNPDYLKSVHYVKDSMIRAAYSAGAKIVDSYFHQFQPSGVSGTIIIEQSHITIHTWYEFSYAAIDFFFCDDTVIVENAINTLNYYFEPRNFRKQLIERKPIFE